MPYDPLQDMAYAADPTLDNMLGVDSAVPPPDGPPDQFQTSGIQGLLEALYNGMGNAPLPPARGFGQGFAQGLVGSLSGQGSKVAAARAKFEAQQTASRAATDKERLAAGHEARRERGTALRELASRQATDRRAAEKQAFENPALTPEMVAANPALGRIPLGTPIPRALAFAAAPKEKTLGDIKAEARARAEGTVAGGGVTLSDPEAAALGAFVRTTGTFPPMGRGGVGSPTGRAILGSMIGQGGGQTPEAVGQGVGAAKGTFAATSGALRNIETSLAQQTVFTNKLKKNTDRLRLAATKIADLGPRFVNGPVRAALGQLGSADQAAYRAALLPVVTESSRLLTSGPTLGGQLSDAARKELESIVSGDFNSRQLKAVLDILENDANNGLSEYQRQRDELRGSLSGNSTPAAPKTYGGIDPLQFVKKGR